MAEIILTPAKIRSKLFTEEQIVTTLEKYGAELHMTKFSEEIAMVKFFNETDAEAPQSLKSRV